MIFQILSILVQTAGLGSASASLSKNTNFLWRLIDALGSHQNNQSPRHSNAKDELGDQRFISPSWAGQTRNLALERWLSVCDLLSVCSVLRQKTQSRCGDRGSAATGVADGGQWTGCTIAERVDPRTRLSSRPISCDAPMWASRF